TRLPRGARTLTRSASEETTAPRWRFGLVSFCPLALNESPSVPSYLPPATGPRSPDRWGRFELYQSGRKTTHGVTPQLSLPPHRRKLITNLLDRHDCTDG